MELCDGSAVLAFTLDGIHSVTCSEIWQLRDEEAASEAEAMELINPSSQSVRRAI